jgi:glycosyltransferase involved in cell wall biosynthesis
MAEPMRILVDGRACRRKGSGVGRMIASILAELQDDEQLQFVVCTDAPGVWATHGNVICVPAGHGPTGWTEDQRLRWEQWSLRRTIRRVAPDVYWAPWNTGVPWRCSVPSVLTVHDIIPLRHAGAFGSRMRRICYRLGLRTSLRAATRVVAVSEATRDELSERCGVDSSRVTVVRHGVEPRFSPEPADGDGDFGLTGRVVLYVGGCEPRKNLAAVFAAFDTVAALASLEDVTLALTGTDERLDSKARAALAAMRHADRVRMIGYVDDEALPALYRRASAFVFPTREEGFGFPPLEAMACGVPVVCSGVDSLPEVVGDVAEIIGADDTEAMARAVIDILTDPARAAEMSRRGIARAATFTWAGAARAMAGLFREVAGSSGGE